MSERETPYTVVVGVSATSKSPTALVWGRAQAEANGGRLVAVRVHPASSSHEQPSDSSQGPSASGQAPDRHRAPLEGDVAEVLAEAHGAEIRVLYGNKRRSLINASRAADVLVIDAPRAPSLSPLLAQRIVYAASCPVVVMPPSISRVPESSLSRSARAVGRAALRSAGTSGRAGYRPPANPDT